MLIQFLRRIVIFSALLIFHFTAYANKITLTLWHNAIDAHETLNWAKVQFNELRPDVTLVIKKYQVDELKNKLIESSINQQSPDAILISSDLLGYQQILELSSIPDDYRTRSFYSHFESLIKHDNYQYAIPIYVGNHLLLYYNQALIKQPFSSFEDLFSLLKTKHQMQHAPIVFWDNQMYWFISVVNAFDGFPILNDQVKVNKEALVKAILGYKRLFDAGMISQDCDLPCIMQKFHQGQSAYIVDGLWAYRKHQAILGDNFGVTALPHFFGKQLTSMRSAVVLAFPQQSNQSEKNTLLKEFALFLQSERVQQQLFLDIGCLPIHQDVITTLLENDSGALELILSEYNRSINMPPNLATVSMWPAFAKGLHFYISGLLSAHDAALYIEDQINREHKKALSLNAQLSDENEE